MRGELVSFRLLAELLVQLRPAEPSNFSFVCSNAKAASQEVYVERIFHDVWNH